MYVSIGVLLMAASFAPAGISTVIFRVEATNATGTGFFEVTSDQLTYNPATGVYSWSLAGPREVRTGGGQLVATVPTASLALIDEPARGPQVKMNWTADAGASTTTFMIRSALVSYFPLPPPEAAGRAEVAFRLEDRNNNGAMLAGLNPPQGLGIYTAQYNGFVPNGTTFSNLIAEISAGAGGTGNASQNDPPFGYRAIGVAVHDMSVQAGFTLTAMDTMGATTSYFIVPEPAAALLAALSLAMVRRR
ncbi:MAG: hypothetical protein AB1716_09525 [Planctomycetota bacterium]